MKKTKKQDIKYKGISANERYLLELIRDKGIVLFGVRELHHLSGWSRSRIHNTLHTLRKKDHIVWIKRNGYATSDKLVESPYAVATESIKPSYISYWTALSHYGFTEQQPKTIQLVTTRQQKRPGLNVEITTLNPGRFYGYILVNDYVIAEKEKSLVDAFHQPEKCGGLDEVVKCLKNAWSQINKRTLYRYLVRFNDKSLNSRAGYIIEALGLDKPSKKLLENKSKSYVRLDVSGRRTHNYDKKWRVIVNYDITGVGE